MRIWLNKYFSFTKSEFNGLIVLLSILFLLKIIPYLYVYLKPVAQDDPNLIAQIQKIELTDERNFYDVKERIEQAGTIKVVKLFNFDPNTLTSKGWQSLGLSPKQAQSIVNYTQKGGTFRKPEDLQKMYTISAERYARLLPFVKIAAQAPNYPQNMLSGEKKAFVKKVFQVVDINTADSAGLDEIKGIGGAFAVRILKYRERLGGFHHKEQLMEVYGLDSTKYQEIKDQISISSVALKVVNVNTAVFDDLKRNPYLSYKQINAIIQYRKQHGNYAGLSDLSKVLILNQGIIDKIAPYISF